MRPDNFLITIFKNPFKIYLTWALLQIVFCFIIPMLSIGSSGGEQMPLTLLAYGVNIAVYGFFILGVVTSFTHRNWFKKFWFINIIIIIFSGNLVVSDYLSRRVYDEGYLFEQETKKIKSGELRIEREYYDDDGKKIKTEAFYINNKKDSVWRSFSKSGKVIKQEVYKNDLLIKSFSADSL